MGDVLYRKYRPISFDDLIGQDVVKSILLEQIKRQEFSHAYLFSGPRGTGKTSVARIFAREVNGGEFNDSTDIIEIDAASNRGIDEIRDLKSKIDFVPSKGKYKVYVVDEVHMLTKEAFNALLKTLEEPPSHTIFILATTEAHKVPTTILSRVLKFDFKLGTRDDIKGNLVSVLKKEKVTIDESSLDLIARHARGSYRDSLSILQKILSSSQAQSSKKLSIEDVVSILGLSNYELVNNFIITLLENNTEGALEIIRTVELDGKSITQFIFEVLDNLRERVFDVYKSSTNQQSIAHLTKIIRELYAAYKDSKYSPIESLPYEIAIMNLETNEEVIPKQILTEKVPAKKKVIVAEVKEVVEPTKQTDNLETVEISSVDFGRIESEWNLLVDRLKEFNHHLSAFVFKSKPVGLNNNDLVIAVPYKIQKNKMDNSKSNEILCREMGSLWGIKKYSITVDSSLIVELKNSVAETDESNSVMVEDVFGV